jgi:putative hemolysin
MEVRAVLKALLASGFSRFPVYEDTLDHVVGVAHIRDLLRLVYEGTPQTRVRDAMYPPLLVPDTVPASTLLATFLQTQQHMAIVVDESGAVDGIVTLEDVLEELVGEIADEHDETASYPIVRRDDGSLLIDGAIPIDGVKAALEVDILPGEEREPFDTLAGFLLSQLGHIPQLGEKVYWGGWCFEIVDMDGLRIDKVLVMQVDDDR